MYSLEIRNIAAVIRYIAVKYQQIELLARTLKIQPRIHGTFNAVVGIRDVINIYFFLFRIERTEARGIFLHIPRHRKIGLALGHLTP